MYRPKGDNGPYTQRGIWHFLDAITQGKFADGPWAVLLRQYGCDRGNALQMQAPCPCVWRRPVTGAVCKPGETSSSRWDWRSATSEREVRLALQHRALAPVVRYA